MIGKKTPSNQNVVVIGLGYVGLPIALAASKVGFNVIGIDNDLKKLSNLNKGVSSFEDSENLEFIEKIKENKISFSSDFSPVETANVILVCVPTPLGQDRGPNLEILIDVMSKVSVYLQKNTLVIIESTVAPGTTRNIILPILEKASTAVKSEFLLAFSPERIDPLNTDWNVVTTPKLISGITAEACQRSLDFYSKFIDQLIICESVETAETAKLLENSFRLVNISFINELAIFCNKIGIDVNDVIRAAATKPYGFMPFYPSIGAGGHCIPVDPVYLADKAKQVGAPITMIDLAGQINREIPIYYVERAKEKLNGLQGKKIIVVGIAYKPNITDTRETPAESLIFEFRRRGAVVSWHDDLVKEWHGEKSVALSSNYDLAILATPHDYLDLSMLGDVPILKNSGSI